MKRILATAALLMCLAAPGVQAQLIWNSNAGLTSATRGAGTDGLYAAQGFTFTAAELVTRFGFYGSTGGGVYKFFIADASNNVIFSDVVTLAATTGIDSDVFSELLAPGTYAFGIIGQDNAALTQTFFVPTVSITQNGVTNLAANENWSNFASPTRGPDGGDLLGMNIEGTSVVATPEPASIALTATGLVGLLGFVRRRRALQT